MALPRYFVPRGGAMPDPRPAQPVALPLDAFVLEPLGHPREEWVVGIDGDGLLAAQRIDDDRDAERDALADRLLLDVRRALALNELARGRPRVLATESLHLFEVFGMERTPDVPGLDDPVSLYGALLGPLSARHLAQSEAPQRIEGQLTVTRGDVLQGLIAGAGGAFLHFEPALDRTVRTMHMLLPGDRQEDLALGRGLVLAYPMLGAHTDDVGPGNEVLVSGILHELLTSVWSEVERPARIPWRDPAELPVPSRARLEQHLIESGFIVDRARGRARRGGRFFSLLGGQRRRLPPEGATDEFLQLAGEALRLFPGWPPLRARALANRVRHPSASATPPAPPPAPPRPAVAPPPPPPPARNIERDTAWIDAFLDEHQEWNEPVTPLATLARWAGHRPRTGARIAAVAPFLEVRVAGRRVTARLDADFVEAIHASVPRGGRAGAGPHRPEPARILDEDGAVLHEIDGQLPRALDFRVDAGARAFVLVVDGRRYLQPLNRD